MSKAPQRTLTERQFEQLRKQLWLSPEQLDTARLYLVDRASHQRTQQAVADALGVSVSAVSKAVSAVWRAHLEIAGAQQKGESANEG